MTPQSTNQKRPFLGIVFKCCNIYTRIYLNHDKTAFEGHCPRCLKPATVRISEDGSPDRFLEVE